MQSLGTRSHIPVFHTLILVYQQKSICTFGDGYLFLTQKHRMLSLLDAGSIVAIFKSVGAIEEIIKV